MVSGLDRYGRLMGGTVVRRAAIDDAATVARLLFDFNTEFGTPVEPVSVLAARFARILELDGVIALLADGDSGFALITLRPAIWFDGPVAQLEELYVIPARRGHGLGTAMIQAAFRVTRERGAPEMHVNVDEVDVDARRFYERQGFANIEDADDGRMLCYIGSTPSATDPRSADRA